MFQVDVYILEQNNSLLTNSVHLITFHIFQNLITLILDHRT